MRIASVRILKTATKAVLLLVALCVCVCYLIPTLHFPLPRRLQCFFDGKFPAIDSHSTFSLARSLSRVVPPPLSLFPPKESQSQGAFSRCARKTPSASPMDRMPKIVGRGLLPPFPCSDVPCKEHAGKSSLATKRLFLIPLPRSRDDGVTQKSK